jgi:Fur family transcriptional regulator, ferric uptake regulator
LNQVSNILKKHNLRNTDSRVDILSLFLNNSKALSHSDLENSLPSNFDRVTIYRTLKSFVENGILHKVPDDSGNPRYALCNTCTDHNHNHDHVHFKCEKCGNTTCIVNLNIPDFNLPKGYTTSEINILVQGICKNCN